MPMNSTDSVVRVTSRAGGVFVIWRLLLLSV
jgi:hypothetical protein